MGFGLGIGTLLVAGILTFLVTCSYVRYEDNRRLKRPRGSLGHR
jgi:hypothetical protein